MVVERRVKHKHYQKVQTLSKKFMVHTNQKAEKDQSVKIESCRPISKRIKWRTVTDRVKK